MMAEALPQTDAATEGQTSAPTQAESEVAPQGAAPACAPVPRPAALRVLLADAQPLSRFHLSSFLHWAGLRPAAVAGSGDEAEILARVLRPTVAVVVLGFAGLGWSMPRRLKAAAPGIRVVLLNTAHASQDAQYRAAAFRSGADACVANTALDELVDTIRELARRAITADGS